MVTSENAAPAEMPGVDRIADEFERELFAWRNLPPRDGAALRACAYALAQKAETLFAPILAELHHVTGERITRKDLNNAHRKGAEEGRLAAHLIDGVNSPHNACCYRELCKALEARALAAEAALAAEREWCALIAENETIHPLGEQIAAAIRAGGVR